MQICISWTPDQSLFLLLYSKKKKKSFWLLVLKILKLITLLLLLNDTLLSLNVLYWNSGSVFDWGSVSRYKKEENGKWIYSLVKKIFFLSTLLRNQHFLCTFFTFNIMNVEYYPKKMFLCWSFFLIFNQNIIFKNPFFFSFGLNNALKPFYLEATLQGVPL